MKGYRTLIFSAFMATIGMLGIKVSPATALHWGDMFVAAWGMGAILLRQVTTTPVGIATAQAAVQAVATPADIAEVRGGIASLLEHLQILEPAGKMLLVIGQKLDAALAIISAAPAADAAPLAPAPDPAPAPAPVPTQGSSAIPAPAPVLKVEEWTAPDAVAAVAPAPAVEAAPAVIPAA